MQEEKDQNPAKEKGKSEILPSEKQTSVSEMTELIDKRVEKLFQDNPELQELEKTMYDPKEKVVVTGEFMNTLINILSNKDTQKQNMSLAFGGLYRQIEINELADSSLTELALTEHVKNLKKKKFK